MHGPGADFCSISLLLSRLFCKGTEVDLNGQTSTKQVATPNLIGQLSIGFWLNRAKS